MVIDFVGSLKSKQQKELEAMMDNIIASKKESLMELASDARTSSSDIVVLHQKVVEKTGGSHGIRDIGLIESAVNWTHATFGGNEF